MAVTDAESLLCQNLLRVSPYVLSGVRHSRQLRQHDDNQAGHENFAFSKPL
jgi:hypothetical protein